MSDQSQPNHVNEVFCLTYLENRADNVETTLASLEGTISTLESRVDVAFRQIDQLRETVTSLEARLVIAFKTTGFDFARISKPESSWKKR